MNRCLFLWEPTMQSKSILSKLLLGTLIKVSDIQFICRKAGDAILKVYNSDNFGTQFKQDGSPVTDADLEAHKVIVSSLEKMTPEWPVLSEEASDIPFFERSNWTTYWLVDPLDGTREFVNHSDEFTINIALIHNCQPVFGMVYLPVKQVFYFGGNNINGAWRQIDTAPPIAIKTRHCELGDVLMVTVSRYMSENRMPSIFKCLHEAFSGVHLVEWAGAIKGCLVADGSVDIYPRPGTTCEWDTAAFQAVVEAAGGSVLDKYWQPLRYNEKDSLLNAGFYVLGDTTIPWSDLLPDLNNPIKKEPI